MPANERREFGGGGGVGEYMGLEALIPPVDGHIYKCQNFGLLVALEI
jgi:hypothetical protein